MNKYLRLIYGLVAGLFALCLGLYNFGDETWKEFGRHGLVETIAMAIAIFGIDSLQRRREELRMLPRRRAAHNDVRLVVARIASFWMQTYVCCVPEKLPASLHDLISEAAIRDKISLYLSLDSQAPVTPARKWWDYWPQQLAATKAEAEAALQRHGEMLDPEVYSDLHALVGSIHEPSMMNVIRQSDAEHGFARPAVLHSYFLLLPDYYTSINSLIDWCNAEAARLESALGEGVKVLRVDETLPDTPPRTPPPCMIDPAVLGLQMAQWQAMQAAASRASGG